MLLTDSINLLMLGSGLLGGFGHCAGMCGPLVATFSLNLPGQADASAAKAFVPHLFYHAGRITTYSVIGGIMGITGSFAGVVRSIEGFQNMTMAAIGLLMIIMGLAASGLFSLSRNPVRGRGRSGIAAFLSLTVNRVIRFISETHSAGSLYAIGMATGFIPCGLLYTAYIAAAGAGSSAHGQAEGLLTGMRMLFLFGLGTTPALLLIGRVAALKAEWVRRRFSLVAALCMIIAGGVLIYRSFRY
jgi:sulfite exporter TauE/SafE